MANLPNVTEEDKWVKSQLDFVAKCNSDGYNTPNAREDVLRFIYQFVLHQGPENTRTIEKLFAAGYCYYFAVMLKDAFGGHVRWHKGYSHIVWQDDNGCCYEIYGIFYDYKDGDIVPLSELGDGLQGFRKIPTIPVF